ncbi:hypothetical protein FSP39_012646 [Pinctada imbricata]|uniref:Uncharacterized protein n=1 Tax=Pinctada imbricata TaxID=66713 RepID=A0AA88XM25_PINIB|nr:hypothetical protein FSP39_012646 [Pinctada imbricata]
MSDFFTANKRRLSSSSSEPSPTSSHIKKKQNISNMMNNGNFNPMPSGMGSMGGMKQGQGPLQSIIQPYVQYQFPPVPSSLGNCPQISEIDVNRIAMAVKNIMIGQLNQMVDEKVAPLIECVQRLSEENKRLHLKVDELEMYSRRSCVRVFGAPEDKKDTDAVIYEIAKKA